MIKFDEFLRKGFVKRQTPNADRAESLTIEAKSKKSFMETVLKNTSAEEIYPNFVVESCYDIILELVRAKMSLDGFKSDSHEAEVSYMVELRFSGFDAGFVDELRFFRNRIKYYGKLLDREYADKVLAFLNQIYPKLKRLVEI